MYVKYTVKAARVKNNGIKLKVKSPTKANTDLNHGDIKFLLKF